MSGAAAWYFKLLRAACCSGALLMAAAGQASADDDELGSLDDDAPKKREPASDDAAADGASEPAEGADKLVEAAPAAAASSGPSVLIRPYAGFGFGTRSFTRPTPQGKQTLPGSVVPAAEAGLEVIAWPQDDFSLSFELHYQTLVGFTIGEKPPFALGNQVDVRSERIELSVSPNWRVGPVRLEVPLGFAVRSFWPNVHMLQTPGYSLLGPQARFMLATAIAGPISFRIGPEVQWIMLIDHSLKKDGVGAQGVALGGEALLNVDLTSTWALGLSYRESHALVSGTAAASFQDIERFLTLRITGTF
jgi:hypothetical protein